MIGKIKRVLEKYRRYNSLIRKGKRAEKVVPRHLRASIVLDDPLAMRRVFQLALILRKSGLQLFIRLRFRDFYRWNKYGMTLAGLEGCHIVRKRLSSSRLLVSDSRELLTGHEKTMLLDYNFFPPDPAVFAEALYIPIMAHPRELLKEYEQGREKHLEEGRLEKRLMVLFAGNLKPEAYDKQHMQDHYGLLNRYEVIRSLIEDPGLSNLVVVYDVYEMFLSDYESGKLKRKVVILDGTKTRIPYPSWISILSSSGCYLALPGYSQPFCHNIIETMAAGSIPITQYGHLFYPPLEHGKECIVFSSYEDLANQLKKIASGGFDDTYRSMQQHAMAYVAANLSLDAAADRVVSFLEGPRRHIKLIMARHS